VTDPAEIGNKIGLSVLAIQVLEAIMAAGHLPLPTELARQLGSQPGEIRDIIQDSVFQQAYHRVVLGKHYYRLDDMIKKTTEQGLEGSVSHQKLFYQLHGLIDAKGIKHITANQFNLSQSPEEIIAKRKALEAELMEELRKEGQEKHRSEISFGDSRDN